VWTADEFDVTFEGTPSISGIHLLSVVQCCPNKQLSAADVFRLQVGFTHIKVMLADANPARAPRLKRVVFMVNEDQGSWEWASAAADKKYRRGFA